MEIFPWAAFPAVLLLLTCIGTSTCAQIFRKIRKYIRHRRANLPVIVCCHCIWTDGDNEQGNGNDPYYDIIETSIKNLQSISDSAKSLLLERWLPKNKVFGPDENLESKLGSGYFGVVHRNKIMLSTKLGEDVLTDVAIKRRNKEHCCNDQWAKCGSLQFDLKEAAFLTMCEHSYVVQLLGKNSIIKRVVQGRRFRSSGQGLLLNYWGTRTPHPKIWTTLIA